jgi:CRP/FNR family transcriptional regulator
MNYAPVSTAVEAASPTIACSSCSLRELCLPVGFTLQQFKRLDSLVETRRSVRRGTSLFRCGDRFEALYAVRTGFFKTHVSTDDGRNQVTGFQMAGELLGLDGICTEQYSCDAVAIEDSQVCVIAYHQLEKLTLEFPTLQRQFHRIMSREIVRDQGVMLLLGSMRAEERVAAFLLNLSQRMQARGFSPSALVLRMTREEIGTYLGLTLETVSRCFSRFHDAQMLEVKQRHIRIVNEAALQSLVSAA